MTETPRTADLYDAHGEELESCDLPLHQYGGRAHFAGTVVTFRAHEENLGLKQIVAEPGEGRVIVVDAGGSTHVAMLGDHMAGEAARNGWAGIVVNGAVRDVEVLATLPIGIKAVASNPRRSRKDGSGRRDVTVSFGNATFEPGAFLVSDLDGVVVLPGR